jgi:hypothetical protein
MAKFPLVAIAVITGGSNPSLKMTRERWIAEGFLPGISLFFCGPRLRLLEQGIEAMAVIEYTDPAYYRNNFHINDKKLAACNAIESTYIYLVHDRFQPKSGFLDVLSRALMDETIDFGAVDVDNPDGTPALRELRLKRSAVSTDVQSALEPVGRLVCSSTDPDASKHIAINGGQFFLRKAMTKYLERPMRWMEMEDDVLSHDLRLARGMWITESGLITVVPRRSPNAGHSSGSRFKSFFYILLCNALALITGTISVGSRIDCKKLEKYLNREFLLIDPLHKLSSSDVLPLSLEKLMTRMRVASSGLSCSNVEKSRLGWRINSPSKSLK